MLALDFDGRVLALVVTIYEGSVDDYAEALDTAGQKAQPRLLGGLLAALEQGLHGGSGYSVQKGFDSPVEIQVIVDFIHSFL